LPLDSFSTLFDKHSKAVQLKLGVSVLR